MVSDEKQDDLKMTVFNSNDEAPLITDKPANLSKKDYTIIAIFGYMNIVIGSAYSSLGPFFPKEAESKGLTPSVYGFLISIQEIVAFLLSPVVGIMVPKLGIRLIMLVGTIMGTIGIILFGALMWAPYGTLFAVLCGLVRCFGSIGMAALFACIYASVPVFFPEHVSQVFGLLEMFYSIGIMLGPFAGGFLYELGGFGLPFFTIGIAMAVSYPMIFFKCPDMKKTITTGTKAGTLSVLSDFRITINLIGSFYTIFSAGFYQVSLEPYIRSFTDLRPSAVGTIFFIRGFFYGISTWLVGLLLPKVKDANIISVIGFLLILIGCLFIGPMYPIPMKPSTALVTICMILIGTGAAVGYVATFTQAMRERDLTNLKDDPGSSALISSLFVSVLALGYTLGPIIEGRLLEYYPFQRTCILAVGMSTATIFLFLYTIIFHKRR